MLHDFSTTSTSCVYRHTPTTIAYATPVCQTDADCADVLPRWTDFMGDEDKKRRAGRCRVSSVGPTTLGQCMMPWRH